MIDCIRKYMQEEYIEGELIGISTLANYCNNREGKVFKVLTELEDSGEIKIITRYFCLWSHPISEEEFPFCSICGLKYPSDYIRSLVYVQPLTRKVEKIKE
jgi:hypothetical protein